MFETWFFAVRGLMFNVSAISALSIPRAISLRTSSSRLESCSTGSGPDSCSRGLSSDASEHQLGCAGRQPSHTLGGSADRYCDAVDRGVLGDEATGSRLEGRVDIVVARGHGEHEHPHVRVLGEDLPGRVGALEVGHAQIHEHDVGLELHRQPHPHAAA